MVPNGTCTVHVHVHHKCMYRYMYMYSTHNVHVHHKCMYIVCAHVYYLWNNTTKVQNTAFIFAPFLTNILVMREECWNVG